MTDLTEIKADLRRSAQAARKAAHDAATGAGEAARDHLMASRLHTGAKVVSAYLPIRSELDPLPLMTALHRAGHRIAVPVIAGKGLPLIFHEWWPDVALEEGPFGARIPVDTHVLIPDLILAPLLAFDRTGARLGYGGGFYDRTLAALRASRRVVAAGFAYAAQEVAGVPTDATDQRLDAIVTERGVIPVQVSA